MSCMKLVLVFQLFVAVGSQYVAVNANGTFGGFYSAAAYLLQISSNGGGSVAVSSVAPVVGLPAIAANPPLIISTVLNNTNFTGTPSAVVVPQSPITNVSTNPLLPLPNATIPPVNGTVLSTPKPPVLNASSVLPPVNGTLPVVNPLPVPTNNTNSSIVAPVLPGLPVLNGTLPPLNSTIPVTPLLNKTSSVINPQIAVLPPVNGSTLPPIPAAVLVNLTGSLPVVNPPVPAVNATNGTVIPPANASLSVIVPQSPANASATYVKPPVQNTFNPQVAYLPMNVTNVLLSKLPGNISANASVVAAIRTALINATINVNGSLVFPPNVTLPPVMPIVQGIFNSTFKFNVTNGTFVFPMPVININNTRGNGSSIMVLGNQTIFCDNPFCRFRSWVSNKTDSVINFFKNQTTPIFNFFNQTACANMTCASGEVCIQEDFRDKRCVKRKAGVAYCADKPCRFGMGCVDNATTGFSCLPSFTLNGTSSNITTSCLTLTCPRGQICVHDDGEPATCIDNDYAPLCLSDNEEYTSCLSKCDPSCKTPTPNCTTTSCNPGCRCMRGFVRENGTCIPAAKCPVVTVGVVSCKGTEVFASCKPQCEFTCRGVLEGSCFATNVTKSCTPGCQCKDGFKRDMLGQCTQMRDCYRAAGCQINEKWTKCMSCENKCGQAAIKCSANALSNPSGVPCWSGCGCINGFSRNSNGTCVLSSKC